MTNSISCGSDLVWIAGMYNKQYNTIQLFCTRGSGNFLGGQITQLLQDSVTAGQLACTSAAESYLKIFFSNLLAM
jgi:hypothetical protein